MKRPYDEGVLKSVDFFMGVELEDTPAKGLKTLFCANPKASFAQLHSMLTRLGCYHLYLGANQSWNESWGGVADMLFDVALKMAGCGIWVTLDMPVAVANRLHLPQHKLIIPVLRVPIARIKQYGPNMRVRIDDTGWDQTNEGVWVLPAAQLTPEQHLTKWHEYKGDKPV